ncbi:hypothetical protein [Stenotrophomonas maltophilia]|uniref:hypothetical protein n=1 Tax=Stenotrophomonas maltophilia TaxID=40324 RepID=UPI00117FFEE4|nr:hypothetical protein [Stenotrophomonas maltophilia]
MRLEIERPADVIIDEDGIDKCEVLRNELKSDMETYGEDWDFPWEVALFFYENYASEEYTEYDSSGSFDDLLSAFEEMAHANYGTSLVTLLEAVDILADGFENYVCDDFLRDSGAIERYVKSKPSVLNRCSA